MSHFDIYSKIFLPKLGIHELKIICVYKYIDTYVCRGSKVELINFFVLFNARKGKKPTAKL